MSVESPRGVPIFATNAFETANPPGSELHDLLTIFLSTASVISVSRRMSHRIDGPGLRQD